MPHTQIGNINYTYTKYSSVNELLYIDPSEIYLAKPGHRLIGRLNGIDEESCSLDIQLNNTNVLEFTISRIIDGEISNYYDIIDRHYELYVTHFGWFKINEEPEISNDGNMETKTIRAESGEIELQQYDLVGFRVNTGAVDSAEMMAKDNVYDFEGYDVAREGVKFYRDLSQWEQLIDEFPVDGTEQDLIDLIPTHKFIFESWRIEFDLETYDDAIQAAITYYSNHGLDTSVLESYVGNVQDQLTAWQLANAYPEILNHITITGVNKEVYDESVDADEYTVYEVLELELQRQRGLSFLHLVLEETDWEPGFIDPSYNATSQDPAEREKLADRIGKFDVDSQDVYSFLTQEASQYYSIVWDFDTENYKVNAYKIETLGADTNIFLSFHNIQNSVTRSSDKDLYTVYHVANGNDNDSIDIKEANFGLNWIEDISYFLNTRHFSQSFIDRYNAWIEMREELRQDYMDMSVDYRDKYQVAQEIYDRVPLDYVNTAQYASFSIEQIEAEIQNVKALKRGYEALYVDDNGDFDIEELKLHKEDWAQYQLIVDVILSDPEDALVITDRETDEPYTGIIDDDTIKNVDMSYDAENSRLGNLDIELYNRWQVSANDVGTVITKLEFNEDYLYDFTKYGDSYGVAELETQLKNLYNKVYAEQNYVAASEDDDEFHRRHHELYVKYKEAYDACATVLEERKAEYEDALELVNQLEQDMLDLREQAKIETYLATEPTDGIYFTAKELWILNRYRKHADYVNENIVTTSISTNAEIIQKEYELYQDAVEQLYADSHPQWTFQTTQDNLLLMPELQDWHGQLQIGNFLRVGFREDDPYYIMSDINDNQVKLRLTGISLNPFMIEESIDLTFSNMIQYKSKRNDFVEILGSYGGASKNQITASYSSSSGETINVTPDLIMKIINSPAFAGVTGSIASAATSSAIGAVGGQIGGLVTDAINNMDISVDQIGDLTTRLTDLVNGYVDANVIATKILYANQANITNLKSTLVDADTVVSRIVNATQVQTDALSAKIVTSDSVVAGLVNATSGDFDDLTANSAFIEHLNSGLIEAGTVSADTIIAGLVEVDDPEDFSLLADSAFIGYLNSGVIEAGSITTNTLIATMAQLTDAQVGTLTANDAIIKKMAAVSTTTIESVVTQQYVTNLVAGHISVADLYAHSATTDQIVLISSNGDPAIAFSNATQQFYDEDGNVRVQIGQDSNGDFNFIVRGADGTTALFDENGITQNGIPNSTIVNNMITDGTIQQSKMGFNIATANADGSISITNVKDGSGNNFGVEYTNFQQNTNSALSDLGDDIDEINSKKMYRVVVESNNGNIFKNGDVNCTLSCYVYSWDDEITDDINAANFTWTRKSKDTAGDTQWNANHSGGQKSITVTPQDVYGRSVFYCTVTLPDGSSATGS